MSIVTMKLIIISCFVLIYNVCNVSPSIGSFGKVQDLIKFYTLQSDTDLSDVCKKQSDVYYKSLIDSAWTKEEWPKEMMDASSKFQAGILGGNLADLGAFDQCLRIDNEKNQIKGKYCLTKLKIPFSVLSHNKSIHEQKLWNTLNNLPVNFGRPLPDSSQRWSICVPDGCTAEDLETHLNSYFKSPAFTVEEDNCQTIESQPKLNAGDWTTIGFLIALACVMVVSTFYDIFLHYAKKDPRFPITVAFSWFTNMKKLVQINNSPDHFPCLNGIRTLSIFWIMYGHEVLSMSATTMFNIKDAENWITSFTSLITTSSTVSVDTFFCLSGLLLMYGFLKSQAKKIPFNIPIFYIHRYLRLTPAYAAMVILYLTLYIKLGTGPKWLDADQRLQDECKNYWWSSLLYIQNYVNPEENCVGQSWYLSVDMQLCILSPLILIPVAKWPKLISSLFATLVVVLTLIPSTVAWYYELPGGMIDHPNFFRIYYSQIYTRAGPWIIGLALGYILFQSKHKKYRMNKIFVTILWLLTAFVMLYIVFGSYPAIRGDIVYSRLYNSLYTGLHRNLWSLGICWIVFACIHGYGGPVNWFLSLSVFQFFARISYSMYIIHVAIQNYDRGTVRIPIIFNDFKILQSFFSTACLSIFFSIIWVLCFEYPFAVIDGVLTGAVSNQLLKRKKRKEAKQLP